MKKILKLIKGILVGIIWCYVYFIIINSILIIFWNFNLISASSWQLLGNYWDNGGAIKAGTDYLLVSILILYIPVWLWSWRKLNKISFVSILLAPICWYNSYVIRKYGESSGRILLKNMGHSKKIEDEIEAMSQPSSQIKTDEEVNKIRNAIAEKISSVKHE